MSREGSATVEHPSVAVYTPFRLALYDAVILGLSCRLVWRCPSPDAPTMQILMTCLDS